MFPSGCSVLLSLPGGKGESSLVFSRYLQRKPPDTHLLPNHFLKFLQLPTHPIRSLFFNFILGKKVISLWASILNPTVCHSTREMPRVLRV